MEQKESKSSRHFNISLAKSGVRILAALCLMTESIWLAGGLLLIAEILGIMEEF